MTGSHLKQFQCDGCNSLAEIVFSEITPEKKWFNCCNQSQVTTDMYKLFPSFTSMLMSVMLGVGEFGAYLQGCNLLAPPQVKD